MTPPPAPVLLGYALQAIVAVQARGLAKVRPMHRPFARLALYVAIVDPLRWPLTQSRAVPGLGHPYEGLTLAGWHLDRALALGWPTGLVAASWAIFGRREVWPHAIGLLGLGTAIGVAAYPALASRADLATAHLFALICAAVAAERHLRGGRWPSETERVMRAYVVAECVAWPLLYLAGDRQMGSKLSWGVYLLALGYAAVSQFAWRREIDGP